MPLIMCLKSHCLFCYSGDVVPVGGTKPGSQHNLPIIPGDTFVEPLSGKLVRVQSGYLLDANVLPSGGGFQALLDSSVLACEARVIDTLRELKDALAGKIITYHKKLIFDTKTSGENILYII